MNGPKLALLLTSTILLCSFFSYVWWMREQEGECWCTADAGPKGAR